MTTLLPTKFGPYGGQFVPETLMPALIELEAAFVSAKEDTAFQDEFNNLMANFVGRPTPVTYAKRLSEKLGGAQIYLKREDLAHTGAHKINNALGQALLAKRMGKKRLVAETGAGQHGVASATAAALLGLECVVYMGVVDIARQESNVFRMKMLGTEVRPVTSGTQTLEGCHQRGHPRLGDECARHTLSAWLGFGAASLSDHGARVPVRDRDGGAPTDVVTGRTTPRYNHRLRRWRLERNRRF